MYEKMDEAIAAYHAFIDNMTRSGGSYVHPPNKDMRHWRTVASLSESRGVTPETLVSARFAATEPHLRRTLRPSSICRPLAAVDSALTQFAPDRLTDYRMIYAAAVQLLQTLRQRMPERTQDAILLDPEQAFPAWFRILHVTELTEEARCYYLAEARNEYWHDTGLRTFIAENLHGIDAKRLA